MMLQFTLSDLFFKGFSATSCHLRTFVHQILKDISKAQTTPVARVVSCV
ncbi:MAG: hypothetical protein J5I59_12910 [Saprospiraceae bacterium]|nr:hypothetical protein [Saprospiraceae bacterium]